MPSVIWACSVTGVLGGTFQMCLVIDVLSMLTLHIYCFYVYAAKWVMLIWLYVSKGNRILKTRDRWKKNQISWKLKKKKLRCLRETGNEKRSDGENQIKRGTFVYIIVMKLIETIHEGSKNTRFKITSRGGGSSLQAFTTRVKDRCWKSIATLLCRWLYWLINICVVIMIDKT